MVLTSEELIGALGHEIKILLHLAGKIDPPKLDFRPTPKQRSTLELLQYLAIMGPTQLAAIDGGVFTRESMSNLWGPAEARAQDLDFAQCLEEIGRQAAFYRDTFRTWTGDRFRAEVNMFGMQRSKGALVTSLILNAHAAYRMQLFCYLKMCGREELNTVNLWVGADQMG